MTTFYLIRHAERDTAPDLLPGRTPGIRLTDRGRAQAQVIARHFRGRQIHRIFSSPLERAVETAAPLARDQRLEVQVEPAFNEMDFGEWTGRRVPQLVGDERWRQFNELRGSTRIPGGETALEVQTRFVSELLRLRELHRDERIACFSHADPIRFALLHFLGAPIDAFARIEVGVASISELELTDWGARLLRLNEEPRG